MFLNLFSSTSRNNRLIHEILKFLNLWLFYTISTAHKSCVMRYCFELILWQWSLADRNVQKYSGWYCNINIKEKIVCILLVYCRELVEHFSYINLTYKLPSQTVYVCPLPFSEHVRNIVYVFAFKFKTTPSKNVKTASRKISACSPTQFFCCSRVWWFEI